VIRKVLFLIGNRHFLIRKCHFGIRRGSYVERGRPATEPFFSYQELPMIRRRLLIAATVIVSVVLAACSDMTAPKNDVCPVTSGSNTCLGH
jgi:pantothenate kinase type III